MSLADPALRVSVARAPGAATMDALAFEPSELEGSVFARFERVAARFPDRDAVRDLDRVTSYAELRDSAVRLGAAIRERIPEASRPIALVLEAGAPLFSAMLGALGAGRLYAPIDPRFPDARIEAILRELEPGGVLVDVDVDADGASAGRVRALLPGGATPVWTLAELAGSPPLAGDTAAAGDPAYVLFTSGSTSRPKGVVQSHRNLLHNVARLTRGVAIGPADRLTLLSSPSFGASVSDVFGALLNGASVCPYSLSGDGLLRLPSFLAREGITVLHSVPSVFRSLAWTLDGGDDLSRVRMVKLGGEPVLATDFELFRNRFPRDAVFHVGYGATEMNVMRQWFAGHETPWPGASPLGHAVDGVEIVLLDEQGRETAGEGEIGVVSTTLAVGYWRDPERTAATFVPVPGRPGVRLYRTGDLGRILPDGCLLHLGRGDARLKVRGHRVETAEVEGELLAVPGVREAAVEGRERDGAVRLAAWVATDGRASLDGPALRRALAERLPPAMVPTQIVLVAALPRTPGGKVDRRALPEAGATSPGHGGVPRGRRTTPSGPSSARSAASSGSRPGSTTTSSTSAATRSPPSSSSSRSAGSSARSCPSPTFSSARLPPRSRLARERRRRPIGPDRFVCGKAPGAPCSSFRAGEATARTCSSRAGSPCSPGTVRRSTASDRGRRRTIPSRTSPRAVSPSFARPSRRGRTRSWAIAWAASSRSRSRPGFASGVRRSPPSCCSTLPSPARGGGCARRC